MSDKLVETFEKLSGKILEIYDVKLSKEITDVYECLVSHAANLMDEHNKLEGRYWDLVKKLAKCEKERDWEREKVSIHEESHWKLVKEFNKERIAKEQAEYDKEYFAKELAEGR